MSQVKRSLRSAGKTAIAIALFAAIMGGFSGGDPASASPSMQSFDITLPLNAASRAGSTRRELEQRQQIQQSSDEASQQRDKQARDITEQQKQLLEYQVRKAQRTNQQSQCRAAGLPNC